MVKLFFIASLLWACTGAVFLAWGFFGFDQMLRHLYRIDREAWSRLGMPCGFFWVPPEARQQLAASSLARAELFWSRRSIDLPAQNKSTSGQKVSFGIPVVLAKLSFACGLISLALCAISLFF
jgi:hypothetical protein